MKLIQDAPGSQYAVTGYGPDHILINKIRHDQSLIVLPEALITPWAASFDALCPQDFITLLDTRPELVLLGTGPRQRFPQPGLLRPLIEAGIGVEVMDLAAACRTYNVLLAEERRVAACLVPV